MLNKYILETLKENEGNNVIISTSKGEKKIIWDKSDKMWCMKDFFGDSVTMTKIIGNLSVTIFSIRKL